MCMIMIRIGVIKTLFEAKCLPVVISGASAGSLIAALICTRTDEQLKTWFTPAVADIFTSVSLTPLSMPYDCIYICMYI
jgi:predicted acylesterase/phospholipase RssA